MLQKTLLSIVTFFAILSISASAGLAIAHHAPSTTARKPNLPRAGTLIVNTYYVTDSSGALVPRSVADPDAEDDTLRVLRSGFRTHGRPNCIEFFSSGSKDTTLISYANNGDIYVRDLAKDSVWNILPFGLPPGKIIRKKLPNDSGALMLKEFNMPHRRTWQVLGTDTVSCQGKTYRCTLLLITDIRTYQGQDWLQGTRYWFSPELGYFLRSNMGWNGPYFLNQQTRVWLPPQG